MYINFNYCVETSDYGFEFKVECGGIKGYPAKAYGPPEHCYPGESDCVEDFTFTLIDASNEDGDLKCSKGAHLDEDEFVWWFGDVEMERAKDLAQEKFDEALEAEYESWAEERAEAAYDAEEMYFD